MTEKRTKSIERLKEKLSNQELFKEENNKIFVSGIIDSKIEFSHQNGPKTYFKTKLKVSRLSGVPDYIPIVIPQKVIKNKTWFDEKIIGKQVEITGKLRSRRTLREDGKKHIGIFISVDNINIVDEGTENENIVYLEGKVSQETILRSTPMGQKITQVNVKVKKYNGKVYCFPCIAWNNVALAVNEFNVEDEIKFYGRLQSRVYKKKEEGHEDIYLETYEISIIKLERN